jgi:predicted GIY-YIG superfamily endonuclease
MVKCPQHGEFVKTAQKHLLGQSCFRCKIDELVGNGVLVGGYSFELFNKNPNLKNKDSYLYYLEINDGELYKIGITINDVKHRIKSIKSKSNGHIKKIKLLFSERMYLFDSFRIENNILKEYNDFRVFTKWSTELFNYNILNK